MKQGKSVIPCHEISVIPRQGKIMTMHFLMAIHLECAAGNGKFFKLFLWGVKKKGFHFVPFVWKGIGNALFLFCAP